MVFNLHIRLADKRLVNVNQAFLIETFGGELALLAMQLGRLDLWKLS